MTRRRSGFTLIELMVVLLVLSAVAALTAPAFARPLSNNRIEAVIDSARRQALETGKPTTVVVADSDGASRVTAMPDGAIIAPARFAINRLSGTPALATKRRAETDGH